MSGSAGVGYRRVTMPDGPELTPDGARRADARFARERVRAQLFGGPPAASAIDRFTLLEGIGAGGMGTVYAAYDPRLDRKVALKLLRDDLDAGTDGGRQGQGRLLREARAMARLSHPNVGAVHDVGVYTPTEDAPPLVWIAMEFIDGEGLRQWCLRATPSAAEILDAYVQMGRGLAAAHTAGLVHRDVKPDNAMRDASGRVRVLDFGLARPLGEEHRASDVDLELLAELDVETFTQTGALVGTPAYMAPEQFDGGVADARSDQYGFCVALFEALWRVRPHAGSSIPAIAAQRRAGVVVDPPRRRDVPAGVRAVLLRGLATDPDQRWPSMDALLVALQGGRPARRSVVLFGGVAAVAVAGALVLASRERDACVDADDAVGATWGAAAADRVRAAFAIDERPFVPATTERVIATLDRYTEMLGAAYRDACVATHETRVQSTELLDRRTACLDTRRTQLGALVGLFEGADAALIERATIAATGLDPIEPCAQRTSLLAVVPTDPASADEVAQIDAELAKAAAARIAGRLVQARELAEPALRRAQATAYRPIVARAHLELAAAEGALGLEDEALVEATEAHFLGAATDQYDVAARAAALATEALPTESTSGPVAQLWHRAGTSAALRLEDGELIGADIDVRYGAFLLSLTHAAEATPVLDRAIEVLQRRLGPDAQELWDAELLRARVWVMAERIDEAHAIAEQAQAHAEAHLAGDPTRLAAVLGSVAQIFQFTGDAAAALPVDRRALELALANLGVDHPTTNVIRVDLGGLFYRSGEREAAAEILAVAVDSTSRRGDGDAHARALHMHAIALKGLRRYDEALAAETRSLDWYRERMPDAPRMRVSSYMTLGNIQLLRDDNAAAESAYLAALDLVERHDLREHRVMVQSDHANFLFQTGRAAEAVTRLEAMLAEMRAAHAPAYELAQYEFDLARALWREGSDRPRAHAVATRVLEILRTEPPTPQVGGHIRRDWTAEEVGDWFADPEAWEES